MTGIHVAHRVREMFAESRIHLCTGDELLFLMILNSQESKELMVELQKKITKILDSNQLIAEIVQDCTVPKTKLMCTHCNHNGVQQHQCIL